MRPESQNEGLNVLRAACAISVFLHHCHLFPGGWLAVDVFFVISGFLITRSIEGRPSGSPRERLVSFYGRRVRRILPPIYIYLGLIIPLVVLFHPELTSGWLASATFTYNFHAFRDGAVASPLLSHTWSLAVEEQFYLLFPFLLLFWRRHATPVLLVIWLAMPVVRLGFTSWADIDAGFVRPSFMPNADHMQPGSLAVYVVGLTQLDAFAIGALLSLHYRRLASRGSAIGIIGLMGLMVGLGWLVTGTTDGAFYAPFLGTPGAYQYVWGYSLVALLGALLVLYGSGFPAVPSLLRPLATLGFYSYEFYILHLPVLYAYQSFVPLSSSVDRAIEYVVCFALTALLAVQLNRAGRQLVEVISRGRGLLVGRGQA
jgi:peptidoglycan/LPS O-acetylase OafA/YrhL